MEVLTGDLFVNRFSSKQRPKRFLHERDSQSYFWNFVDEPKQIYGFEENLYSNCKLGKGRL